MTRHLTRQLDICIVTCDIVGPIRNGGIGTAYYSLAHALARAGHRVTVLYALGAYCENGRLSAWVRTYAAHGITFVPLPPGDVEGHSAIRMADGVYRWLKTRDFDIVHYHEWRGIGAFAAQAKRQGLALQRTLLVAGAHSPTLWHKAGMREMASAEDLEVDHLERMSVANADVLWSPSRHMLAWLEREGWTLPRRRVIKPYVLLDLEPAAARRVGPAPELVFFGRLETRKGLDLFCDALDRVVAAGRRPSRVTFMGKIATVNGLASDEYLRKRAERWTFPWRIDSTRDRDRAMAYLRRPNRVAVLPSRLDNLPYTVLECLGSAIPFVAAETGGIPEMIAPRDRRRVLFDLSVDAFAARLLAVIAEGLGPAPLRIPADRILADWLAWHVAVAPAQAPAPGTLRRSRARTSRMPSRAQSQPLVSICVTTRNRPALLPEALESIRNQDYPRIEVVLVDDGSTDPRALALLDKLQPEFDARGWTIVRQENRYLGAARNAAIAKATGSFILFMDDDNAAEPHEVSTFVRAAAATGADILTCFLGVYRTASPVMRGAPAMTWPFLGAALAPGVLRNVFGDANAFVRRSVFDRIGGFTEDVGIGCEDWEFFARAVLHGLRLEVVPERLVKYRQSPTGMLQSTSHGANHARALRPYLSLLPAHLRSLAHLASQVPAHRPHTAMTSAEPARAIALDSVRRAVVFGSGEGGRRAIDLARRCGWDVPWLVDNNPGMWNQRAHDLPVRTPQSLTEGGFDVVVVASVAGKDPIAKQLADMGLTNGEQFVHFLDPIRVGNVTYQLSI